MKLQNVIYELFLLHWSLNTPTSRVSTRDFLSFWNSRRRPWHQVTTWFFAWTRNWNQVPLKMFFQFNFWQLKKTKTNKNIFFIDFYLILVKKKFLIYLILRVHRSGANNTIEINTKLLIYIKKGETLNRRVTKIFPTVGHLCKYNFCLGTFLLALVVLLQSQTCFKQ